MYKDKLFNLAINLSKTGHFLAAQKIVKVAIPKSESLGDISNSYELRKRKLEERGITSNLSKDDILVILSLIDDQIKYMTNPGDRRIEPSSARCSYCDRAIISRDNISLDRVDNSQGYVLGNLVFACKDCNMFKGQYHFGDYIRNSIDVANNLKNYTSGRKKVIDDAKKLKQVVEEYLNKDIAWEEGYTGALIRHPNVSKELRPQESTTSGKSSKYSNHNESILKALGRATNIPGIRSAEDLIQTASNILSREMTGIRLDWSYSNIKRHILKNFDSFKEMANKGGDEDSLFALEVIESDLLTDNEFIRSEQKLLILSRSQEILKDILKPLESGIVNTEVLVRGVNDAVGLKSITLYDIKEFIINFRPKIKLNFYMSILNSKKQKIIDIINDKRQNENYTPHQIIIHIHKTLLANAEDGRKAVSEFIERDSDLSNLINQPFLPRP